MYLADLTAKSTEALLFSFTTLLSILLFLSNGSKAEQPELRSCGPGEDGSRLHDKSQSTFIFEWPLSDVHAYVNHPLAVIWSERWLVVFFLLPTCSICATFHWKATYSFPSCYHSHINQHRHKHLLNVQYAIEEQHQRSIITDILYIKVCLEQF